MKVAHLLRKYNPAQWGGTEAAVLRLLQGLRAHRAEPIVFCPEAAPTAEGDPFAEAGIPMTRFRAKLPVWGISEESRQQAISIGGNLLSFELVWRLLREPGLDVIHTHTLNRLGGTALTVARCRKLPLVVTIHGGLFDLPAEVSRQLAEPMRGGLEWGRLFGLLLNSKQVVSKADAVLTCNPREAELIRERYPRQRVIVQPHGLETAAYRQDHRAAAHTAFPALRDCPYLMVLGRLDPTKNQAWLLEQAPALLASHPELHFVFVGPSTNAEYQGVLLETVRRLGLAERVHFTGGLPPGDPQLLGLIQQARALVIPSHSETFGLVILEAWAARTPVLSSRTSGALSLLREGENGWLFDLADPSGFAAAVAEILHSPPRHRALLERAQQEVISRYDLTVLAGQVRQLYDELIAGLSHRCTTS